MKFLNKLFLALTGASLDQFDQSKIISGTIESISIQFVSIILVFLSNLLWVKLIGANDYGIFVHVFNWIAILSVVALGGREDLLLAEIPRYEHESEKLKINSLIRYANRNVLTRSAYIIPAFLALIFLLPVPSLSEYRFLFLSAAISILFMSVMTLNQTALQALHRVKQSQIVEKLLKPALLIIGAIVVGKSVIPRNSESIIIANVLVTFISAILLLAIASRYWGKNPGWNPNFLHKDLRKKTIYFFFISLLYILGTRIHMLILSFYYPGRETGIFNICYRFADLLILPSYLMHYVLPQIFAKNIASGEKYNQSLFNSATRIMLLLSLPLVAVISIFGNFLLGWFGEEFTSGYTCLVLLTIGQFFFSLAILYNTVLMTQDSEKQAAFCLLIFCSALAITNFTLIPLMGINGAGWAGLISSLLYYVAVAIYGYRLRRIYPPFLSWLLKKQV